MRILVEQLNGDTLDLEVTAEMTMSVVKEKLKGMRTWEDELSRRTALVELIVGDKKVINEETVEELGLCEDSKVAVVFRSNMVQCSNKRGLGPDLDPEAWVVVKIPDSETAIEANAFQGCWRIAKVIIPCSVTKIGDGAFRDCTSLVSVSIPDSVRWISNGAFLGCSALTEVTIPDSIKHMGRFAFLGCKSLQSVSIPNSMTQIQIRAFQSCNSLTEVTIPHAVTQIGDHAFANCSSLTSVDIPDSVTTIRARAFANCNQLTLTAPARLLVGLARSTCWKIVAKECGCGRCDSSWFLKGWVCPVHQAGQ